ncbi:hypothetical protein SLS58_010860 [Diplodia intermedia]|uniref:Uncharacterized protein n=1 Tax=Diplodia intermedia TaxID=856260 RepID=A0ABR3T457_9PEZI
MHDNEGEVGEVFDEVDIVEREVVFVTTKLWCAFHSHWRIERLDTSFKRPGLNYTGVKEERGMPE